ncbi:peptide chain release factor N(5)-glutamine methyltransferase [Clostridium algidicarnis]|uniref:peptide chain release factor N(5)-glutamine methyltransferase n=1 Tax=Clostridium algidicarnis TaxID=37659 RepID=UPI001C0C1DBE|nr:peptide chain release factor N(5)-glutamine methyltransferase [Clostridium algidicarnis]MBU3209815.1 peptide chain release factor N(5)-glutamine methyltransferase [Clostridium algidicarnis]MBU3228608.1 peptide chain release factor N(5)-glutamine methyltransferase [Clostridium algidicarnis]MBU3251915.1 peptide chain release factor N(5)-glutamine methyltransferase [Clostridium algidicarnis]
MKKDYTVGGQAIIEGVMMRGNKGIATAIRIPDGTIKVEIKNVSSIRDKNKILRIPIIRGFIALIESLVTGIETLNYSSSFFEEEEEESESSIERFLNKLFKDKSDNILMGIILGVSFIISGIIFILIPTVIANLFKKLGVNNVGLNIIEGVFRVSIFMIYIVAISKMEDVYRLLQYHGAEHKTIFCYEAKDELTVENVMKYKRLHPRCGTNFLFLVMIVSIILLSITGWSSLGERVLYRILLLPIVSGFSFEIIKWLSKSNSKLSKILAYPGLKLQMLTTREPDESQIEVAIASLKAAEGIKEPDKTIGELLNMGNEMLKDESIPSYILDTQLLLAKTLEVDKLYVITNRNLKVNPLKEKEFMQLMNLRKGSMPIKYILGNTEFMGIDLNIKEGVLIPRPDTENLVEIVLEYIEKENYENVCDLCTGSGAIGISLAYHKDSINVHCIDISPISNEVVLENINKFGLNDRVSFIKSDLLEIPIKKGYKYDVLVSNPPYIKSEDIDTLMKDVKAFEPHLALDGGEDGLEFYKTIIRESKEILNAKGFIAFEIGKDQGVEVSEILDSFGYKNIKIIKDLSGFDRVVIGKNSI